MRNSNHKFEKKIYSKFSQLIKNQKNFIPLKFFHRPETSSHYSGYNYFSDRDIYDFSSKQVFKDIYLNDSTLWDFIPSYSPTFSIMAYANKFASEI